MVSYLDVGDGNYWAHPIENLVAVVDLEQKKIIKIEEGPVISTVTYNDNDRKRKVMYEGALGGMIVPYSDPDVGWYFKAYLDAGATGIEAVKGVKARTMHSTAKQDTQYGTLIDHNIVGTPHQHIFDETPTLDLNGQKQQ